MSETIAALLARVGLKQQAAFRELYRLTSPKLFGVCLRMLKRRSDAEDALQEVYVRIWQGAAGFAGSGQGAWPWLFAVARHHCLDRLRRQMATVEIEEAADIADPGHDPETALHWAGEGKRIDTCMEALEASRAAAVRQAYVEGLSYRELADHHNVPLNTMRTWLRRSLLTLRECMDR
ncbi:sigma-70 family RNA polymerase sigma factor [Allorhizobium undicola]|uniref:sigma-70 family RNA polymerase sigma factor n=1 Tax=Allorhizobium undicola TaxID=78527 RepID=UPI003D352F94